MIAAIQELLQKESQAVLNIPVTDAYERAVELIVEQVLSLIHISLPYHDGKKTKSEQSPFHDHKVHANIARNPSKQ